MRHIFKVNTVTIILFGLIIVLRSAGKEVEKTMDKQQIIMLYRQENQAMIDKDLATLEKILSDDMHLIHMTGYDQSKKEWLEQIKNEQMSYFSSEEECIKDIKIKGNNASFIGQNKVDARIYGSRNIWNLEMKMFFEKRKSSWVIVRQEACTY